MRKIVAFFLAASAALFPVGSKLWSQSRTGNELAERRKMEAIDKAIRGRLSPQSVPSISFSIIRRGKVLYESGYGLADREKRISATPNTPYYVASVSKALTGTSLVILEAEHKIDLDRPANDYLHSAKLHSPIWDVSQATVRRLADHTAGLTTYDRACVVGNIQCQASTDVAIERYGIVFWPPGDHFDYSNLGYGVLGQVISNVSGQPLPEFLEQNIFRPLEMRDCYLSATGEIRPGSAANYDDPGAQPSPPRMSDTPAASSVRCSAHDLAIFGSFVMGESIQGQKQILSKNRLHELLYSDKASAGKHYSFGWERNTLDGYDGVFAEGGTADSSAALELIPDAELSIAVVLNTGSRVPLEIVNRIVANLLPAKKNAPSTTNDAVGKEQGAEELAGRWTGEVKTWKGNVPLVLSISSNSVQAGVGRNVAILSTCEKPDVNNGRVHCVTRGDLKTPDAPSPPYNVELEIYFRRGALFGAATAESGDVELPYWVVLAREGHWP